MKNVLIAILFLLAGCGPDEYEPAHPADASVSVDEGQEIFIDEDAASFPIVTAPDRLGIIMRDETIDGQDALHRCMGMGGSLTLDMICHDVQIPPR